MSLYHVYIGATDCSLHIIARLVCSYVAHITQAVHEQFMKVSEQSQKANKLPNSVVDVQRDRLVG